MKAALFRGVCGRFATGVAVLTVLDPDGHAHGLTVNSFTSVSLDPPLVLVCIESSSSLLPYFQQGSYYGLSFLAEEQADLSIRFATVPERRFDGVHWRQGETGVPILDGAIGSMECQLQQSIIAGDHHILVAEFITGHLTDAAPLLYFQSSYRNLK